MPLSVSLDVALRDRLVMHLVQRVNAICMSGDPFPHVVVPGFFPDETYHAMLNLLPAPECYEPFHYHKHHTGDGTSNRQRFCFGNEWLLKLPSKEQSLWLAVRSAVGSPGLKRAVFEKLAPGLAFRYGCANGDTADLPGYALPELFRETAGYRIAPHPDTRKKVVTMQIALPADESQQAFGTEFYRRSFHPGHWLREPRGFETVKTMPFLPNTAYAFVVLNSLSLSSWHGRSSLSNVGQAVRNTILNIWYERPENGNRELVEEYGAGQRRAA